MGLLDPLDKKLSDRVDPGLAGRAAKVARLVDYYGDSLSHHHRREVSFLMSVRYISWAVRNEGAHLLSQASTSLLANAGDQANRIQSHLTPDQQAVAGLVAGHIESDGDMELPNTK